MRKLIVLSSDNYVRNLVTSGALEGVADDDTIWAISERLVSRRADVEARPGRVVAVADPLERAHQHNRLRTLLLYQYRGRSRTMATKARLHPRSRRIRYTVESLPGLRQLIVRRRLRRLGTHRDLHELMERERPDIVIAPSGGTDTLVSDAIASGRDLRIPTLVLVQNWDNLSSKGAFPVKPDYLGVWGEQSAEHANRIHGVPRERVGLLGAPQFESYFRHRPGSTTSPFPYRYVLFAGCYAPFDERDALRRLDAAIEAAGLDLAVVYRPHPHRAKRLVDDRVRPGDFRHVVLDPQLEPAYRAHWEGMDHHAKPLLPSLDYYPALFEHAELVICPLSTMLVEAAIFDRRVLVVAYDDGIHPNSPATVVHFDHFEGVDRIDGFELVREAGDLGPALTRTLAAPAGSVPSLRAQIGWWLHHDERSYSERLRAFVAEIARREGIAAAEALPAATR
jgi:hypothetical protein